MGRISGRRPGLGLGGRLDVRQDQAALHQAIGDLSPAAPAEPAALPEPGGDDVDQADGQLGQAPTTAGQVARARSGAA